MRLTVEPRSAVVTIVALYETEFERAMLDELLGTVTDVLPKLLAALIGPGES